MDSNALRAACTRFLSGHGPKSAASWLQALASSEHIDLALDIYSQGPAITRLEAECAALLGKPAALFFHKGVTAQLAALLVHATPARGRAVALHPMSHLAYDETDALDRLARLHPVRVGRPEAPFGVEDLARLAQPLAAVTVEIPLRRAGFLTPDWAELVAISAWCRAQAVPLHLDGARIWEVAPYYGKSLADIAALSETVYVSFYKGLGGMGGCVVAGPTAFIDACRPWRNRFGGDLPTIFPYVVTALDGLRRHLPRMQAYHDHARALATALAALPGVATIPATPHGNSFALELPIAPDALARRQDALAAAEKTWLFGRLIPTAFADRTRVEIAVGEATLAWPAAEVAAMIARILR